MVDNAIKLLDKRGCEHLIRGILFDKDDTLLDLAKMWREPLEKTAKASAFSLRGGERGGAYMPYARLRL